MILALTLLVVTADPAGAVVTAPAKPKLLVLDFQDQGVGENAVKIIHDSLAANLSRDTRLEVISTEDMRRALDVEAQKRAMGSCSDESCLAEIAEALGAQLTLYGTVGKLGDLVVVNVSLFDARAQKSVGREVIEAKSLQDLPSPLREAGDRLIARLPGFEPAKKSFGVVAWTGLGTLGVGVVAGVVGGTVAYFNNPVPGDGRTFPQKEAALPARDFSAVVAVAGAGVAVVGAGVFAAGLALE